MNTLHLNQQPQDWQNPQPETPPTQTTSTAPDSSLEPQPFQHSTNSDTEPTNFDSVDDYFQEITGDRKLSADTTINEDTGTIEPHPDAPDMDTGPGAEKMTEQEAKSHTRTLIDMRDTVQAMALAFIGDGNFKQYTLYQYQEWQKQILEDAYSPLISKMGLKVPMGVKILYAEAVTATPLFALAVQNRKYRLENEELKAKLRRQKQKEKAESTAVLRRDVATLWKIDENGYFINRNDKKMSYIKATERTERPGLSDEEYRLLCQHNGKEFVDKVFNI